MDNRRTYQLTSSGNITQMRQTIKTGKRVSVEDLFKYIKSNKESFRTVGCVDLNDTKEDIQIIENIERLHFQDSKKVNFLPKNLAHIFKFNSDNFHKYLHSGVFSNLNYSYDKRVEKVNINVSLYSSVITCLKQSFLSQPVSYQSNFITKFIDRLRVEITTSKSKTHYKKLYKWKNDELHTDLVHDITGCKIIKYLCDFLHINIFILDIDDDNLYYGGGEQYIPYKKNIFLLKYSNDIYEPFFTEHAKTFGVNEPIIKTIKQNISLIKIYQLSEQLKNDFVSELEEIEENLDIYKTKYTETYKDKTLTKILVKNNKSGNVETILGNDDSKVSSKVKPKDDSYDETMNEYDDDSDSNNTNIQKLNNISDSDNDSSSSEVSKKSNNVKTSDHSKENKKTKKLKKEKKQKYNLEDIKSSLKLEELRKIAKDIDVELTEILDNKVKAKTKSKLIEQIKEKLAKK